MLASTILYSLDPLIVSLTGAPATPLLFTTAVQTGQFAVFALFTALLYPDILADPAARRAILQWTLDPRRGTPLLIAGTASGLNYVLYLYCARVLDVTAAAVLAELWLIFAVPTAWVLAKNRNRYGRLTPTTISSLGIAVTGAALVTAGQSSVGNSAGLGAGSIILGGTLGILASVTLGLTVALFRWSEELADRLPRPHQVHHSSTSLELFATSVAICITGGLSVAMNASAGLAAQESITAGQVAIAVAMGAVLYFAANILWRAANIITFDLAINAITSLTPILSLMWIWAWHQASLPGAQTLLTLPRPGLVAAGATLVVAGNIALQWRKR